MSTENSSDPIPCAAGCGFFGREATNNMCSKCFREHQERAKAAQAATATPPPPSSTSVASPAVTEPSVTSNPVLAPAVPANMMTCTPCPEPQPAPAVGDSPLAPTPSSDAAVAPHPQSAAVGLISAPETLAPMLTPSHSASLAPAAVAAANVVTSASASAAPSAPTAVAAAAAAVAAPECSPAVAAPPVATAKPTKVSTKEECIEPPRKIQKNRKRCFSCNRKVGLTGMECRCKYIFCSRCRYPDQHNCTFDYKNHDRKNLSKIVQGGGQFSKLEKIE